MIAATPPINGIIETFGGVSYPMVLTIGGIERFEKQYRGVYDLYDGWMRNGTRANTSEVRDLVAYGLVGGGLTDAEADALIAAEGTRGLQRLELIAVGLLGTALVEPISPSKSKKKAPAKARKGST